jgi:hypothetical protein
MTQTFDHALQGLDEMDASVGDRDLVHLLARHGREEGAILEQYQRFSDEADSPAVRYLVRLIVDDEQRHHRILGELANAIAWGWGVDSEPVVPQLAPVPPRDARLLAGTRELLAAERADARELHKLRKRLRPYAETTLWDLLVEILELDTRKHVRILEFIEHEVVG